MPTGKILLFALIKIGEMENGCKENSPAADCGAV